MTTYARPAAWPLQRLLFLIAGTVTLSGITLGAFVSPWFLLLPTAAGANQLLMVAVGWCPMSLLLQWFGVTDRAAPTCARNDEPHTTVP
jgi:hypothetical protein